MLPYRVKYQVPDRCYIWRKTLYYHRGLLEYAFLIFHLKFYSKKSKHIFSPEWLPFVARFFWWTPTNPCIICKLCFSWILYSTILSRLNPPYPIYEVYNFMKQMEREQFVKNIQVLILFILDLRLDNVMLRPKSLNLLEFGLGRAWGF